MLWYYTTANYAVYTAKLRQTHITHCFGLLAHGISCMISIKTKMSIVQQFDMSLVICHFNNSNHNINNKNFSAKALKLRKKSIAEGCKADHTVKHEDMDADCLSHLFNNYHTIRGNAWQACSTYTYNNAAVNSRGRYD